MDNKPRRASLYLLLVPVLMLAFNLRPITAAVGPVLEDIRYDLPMSGALAGVLTSLPALCFSVFGLLAPGIARRLGEHLSVLIALVALTFGQLARAYAPNAAVFLALTVLALAGMAMGNVLLPSLIRRHFPDRIGLATSLYSLFLAVGVTVASVGVVPLALSLGGWRAAFAAGSTTAVAALLCWLPMLRYNRLRRRSPEGKARHYTILDVARTRIGWAMAIFFAIQSGHAYSLFGWLPTVYTDAGLDQVSAGFMLGIMTGLGIIPAFVVPVWVDRMEHPLGLLLLIQICLAAGFAGLIFAPATLPWLWAALLAIGLSSFPLFLALIATRARTAEGTSVLSGFSQSVGYLIGATGPFMVGILYEIFDDWTIPLLTQMSLGIPMTLLGLALIKPWFIEDKMRRRD